VAARPITFLSDYGADDEFAGVCRAVIARIAPDAPLTDITHGIAPGDVRRGALALEAALPHCAEGVHMAVVDPGVGTARRALALRVREGERLLVGPDNGLLWLAAERFGGAVEAADLARSEFRLEPLSATFHGRDLFAPVAARLALGAELAEAGEPIDPGSIEPLALPEPVVGGEGATAHVLYADRFGNLVLDLRPADLDALAIERGARLRVDCGSQRAEALRAATFASAPAGGLVLYDDSSGRLGLAVNQGSAAAGLGVGRDDEVELAPLGT
jgi:S-adenosylmethionine hydrolase